MTASSDDSRPGEGRSRIGGGILDLVGLDRADDLPPGIRRLLERADVIAGPARWMTELDAFPAEKLPLAGGLDAWLGELEARSRKLRCVALASGDPNFYGLARKLLTIVPPERTVVHPSTTTVQKAFARLKTTWAGAEVESLHGRDGWRALFAALFRAGRGHAAGRVAVYTDPSSTPGEIARRALARGCSGSWGMTVFEDLDAPGEKVTGLTLEEASGRKFSDLNLVVLTRLKPLGELAVGLPESAYEHEAGLITKSE
ncbi:MAG: precorrin-6y C5,15-methyltransferase (decarboxylating) subunit CbiE, partial [Deltaproteobacteria bacterium]|nr:precorrin-6y C5,15-methyltransferase (decarboxylating) subunit CbiE [Deltaproteobacteria bacterium]